MHKLGMRISPATKNLNDKGINMKHVILITAAFVAFGLSACDKPTVVVPMPVVTPGPAGPQGPTGNTGATGRPGDSPTVIVTPPAASAPSN